MKTPAKATNPAIAKHQCPATSAGSKPYSMAHHHKPNSQTYFYAVENYAAIPDVCAWPTLHRLKDGTLITTIFNQPCHLRWEGDLDCWASQDDGKTWHFRGRPAPHDPGTNRLPTGVGIAADGSLVVVSIGYDERLPVGTPINVVLKSNNLLRPWICRSADGGRTWDRDKTTWPADKSGDFYISGGNIVTAADGDLCAAAYAGSSVYLLRSHDDGRTWGDPAWIQEHGDEMAILHLGDGRWLAAIRQGIAMESKISKRKWTDDHLELFRSEDDGRTWRNAMPLSLPHQMPGNLLRLRNGRILLTYGSRCLNNCGVDARFSEDEGETWSSPIRIGPADLSSTDCGYPSSVELPDGRVVTVYYASRNTVKGRDRDPEFTANQARKTPDDQLQLYYEMRVSRWRPGDF